MEKKMADEVKEILLKLKIDNKEYQATVDVSKGKLVELVKLIDPLEQKFESAYKKITAELSKYNSASEQNIKTLTAWLSAQNISVDEIERTIAQITTETKQIDVNTAAWQKSMAAVENLRGAHGKLITGYDQTTQSQMKMTGGVNSMNMAIGQFGFLVGDADMFMVNFRMGMMSIANNVPMVIQFMQYAKQEAAGLNMTLGQAFFQSIKGPGGLLLGANAAMFAMNILAGAFSDTTEEVSKQKDEVDKLSKSYEKLTRETLENQLIKAREELNKLKEKEKTAKVEPGVSYGGGGMTSTTIGGLNEKEKERKAELEKEIPLLNATIIGTGDRENISRRITNNQERLNHLSVVNLANYKDIIEAYKLGNLTLEKQKEKVDEILNKWISADEKLISGKGKTAKHIPDKINSNNELVEATEEYYNTIKFLDESYFEWKSEQIIRIGRKWIAQGHDQVAVEKWINEELKKLVDERDGLMLLKPISMKNMMSPAEMMNKALEVEQRLRDDLLQTATQFGNILEVAFSKSGKTFMFYINQALQAALKVVNILNQMDSGSKSDLSGILGMGGTIVGLIGTIFGFAEGGLLPQNKMGFFEGKHNEIVAPEKDFIQVTNDLIYKGQIAIAHGYGGAVINNNIGDLSRKMDELNSNIEKLADRPARAFITQDDFNDGYANADLELRKNT